MKPRPLAMVVFLFFSITAANSSRRHRRTLPATTKKPASVAGFLLTQTLPDSHDRLYRSFSFPKPTLHSPPYLNLFTQTPSSP